MIFHKIKSIHQYPLFLSSDGFHHTGCHNMTLLAVYTKPSKPTSLVKILLMFAQIRVPLLSFLSLSFLFLPLSVCLLACLLYATCLILPPSVSVCVCLCVSVSACLSVCLSVSLSRYLSFSLCPTLSASPACLYYNNIIIYVYFSCCY